MSQPNTSHPTLSHNLSYCFPSDDIPWHAMGDVWPGDCEGRILRALDDGSVRSALVRLPEGSSRAETDTVPATVQGFVLSGVISLGDVTLKEGGFFAVPPGHSLPALSCREAAEMLLIFEAEGASAANADPVFLSSAYDMEAIVPVINGEPIPGFERRVLWEDPESGADTRLLKVPAGFEGKGTNWHPVHEEIFCLDGDIGPNDIRLLKPGSYLHNPAFGVHGYHEHSNGGATVLEWHDGRWAINFTN